MKEEFRLKDGRVVEIKRLMIEDYKTNNNYEYVHSWLNQVNNKIKKEL